MIGPVMGPRLPAALVHATRDQTASPHSHELPKAACAHRQGWPAAMAVHERSTGSVGVLTGTPNTGPYLAPIAQQGRSTLSAPTEM